jgi:hypothetical protein
MLAASQQTRQRSARSIIDRAPDAWSADQRAKRIGREEDAMKTR